MIKILYPLGQNINTRHSLLQHWIGTFLTEDLAFHRIMVLAGTGLPLVFVLSILSCVLFKQMNHKFHPFAKILEDNEGNNFLKVS